MREDPLAAIVLAAGEGSRMRSSRPKPLHHLCGRPMLQHIVDALAGLQPSAVVVVVGHRGDWVTKVMIDRAPSGIDLTFVDQPNQLGTGDAAGVGLTGLDLPDPTGYGRIIRNREGSVVRIVEDRDATAEERAVTEVNTSIYCFKRSLLTPALRRLQPSNVQGEYYLTDAIEVLAGAGHLVGSVIVDDAAEVAGVNDRGQLAEAERAMRRRINRQWLARGVTMWDPEDTYIDADVELDPDVVLMPGVILRGATTVASGAELGPDVLLTETVIGRGATVRSTTAEMAVIGDDATVGPYVSLPPGYEVPAGATVTAASFR